MRGEPVKAAVFRGGYYDVCIEDVPEPVPGPGEAVIRVEYAGICGSDLTVCEGGFRRVRPPVILGHEFSGRVEEVHDGCAVGLSKGTPVVVEPLLSCGECYACRSGFAHVCKQLRLIGIDVDGAFAPYVKVLLQKVYRVPDTLPLDQAALVEPLAVAVHVVRRSKLKVGDSVIVFGAGPIGVLVAQVARVSGASRVIVVEISEFRLSLAQRLGFATVDASDPAEATRIIDDLTQAEGGDVVFEVTGATSVASQLVRHTRIRGQIVIVGVFKDLAAVDMQGVALKELSVIGSRVYEAFDFARAIDLLSQGKVDVSPLISHVLPVVETARALEVARQARESMKVLLKP